MSHCLSYFMISLSYFLAHVIFIHRTDIRSVIGYKASLRFFLYSRRGGGGRKYLCWYTPLSCFRRIFETLRFKRQYSTAGLCLVIRTGKWKYLIMHTLKWKSNMQSSRLRCVTAPRRHVMKFGFFVYRPSMMSTQLFINLKLMKSTWINGWNWHKTRYFLSV